MIRAPHFRLRGENMREDSAMPQLRIAAAQVNTRVGDLAGNADLIVEWTRKAAEQGAHLVVFPEMALTGDPVEDLALRESFTDASKATLASLATRLVDSGCGSLAVDVGYLGADTIRPHNAAAVLYEGRVAATQFKHHLPNYGVFDERSYYKPGQTLDVVQLHGVEVGMVICEDLWQDGGPVTALGQAGVDLVVSPNASPYEKNKDDQRLPLVARRAAEAGAPLVYLNLIGGPDELRSEGHTSE